jgi:cytosine/adenosine deaminase-related metal-dependent hydrolase
LDDLARNVLTWEGASVGSMLYLAAAQGGAQTLRRDAGASHEAALADLTAIDSRAPAPPVKFQIRLVRSLTQLWPRQSSPSTAPPGSPAPR